MSPHSPRSILQTRLSHVLCVACGLLAAPGAAVAQNNSRQLQLTGKPTFFRKGKPLGKNPPTEFGRALLDTDHRTVWSNRTHRGNTTDLRVTIEHARPGDGRVRTGTVTIARRHDGRNVAFIEDRVSKTTAFVELSDADADLFLQGVDHSEMSTVAVDRLFHAYITERSMFTLHADNEGSGAYIRTDNVSGNPESTQQIPTSLAKYHIHAMTPDIQRVLSLVADVSQGDRAEGSSE